jgi:hypothetical protein
MGRGDENILFNPPKIKKPREILLTLGVAGSGKLKAAAQAIVSIDENRGLSLQQKDDGNLLLRPFLHLESPYQEQEKSKGKSADIDLGDAPHVLLEKDSVHSLTSSGLAWTLANMLFFIREENILQDPEIHPLTINGEITGLHAGESELSYLWKEDGTDKIYLSSIPSNGSSARGRDFYSKSEDARMESKGEKSIVIFSGRDGSHTDCLVTITENGIGDLYPLDQHSHNSLRNAQDATAIASPRNKSESSASLITPAAEDGTYFYFDAEEGSLCFLDLRKGDNDIIKDDVDITEDGQINRVLDIKSNEDKALLLTEEGLSLYDKSGLVDKIAIKNNYRELSLTDGKALLWNKGKDNYLEIKVP